MAFQVRRVITGHDENGRAVVKIDEVCNTPSRVARGRRASTCGPPRVPRQQRRGRGCGPAKVGTTLPDGTIFRMLEFAPGLAARNHRTDSIDYIVVLSGEIEMELDATVVQLKAGDARSSAARSTLGQSRDPAVRARGHPLVAKPVEAGGKVLTAVG